GQTPRRVSQELQETFDRTVEEGVYRVNRSTQSLLATGLVGGLDVAMGVFALLLVKQETKSETASAVAFSIGFIALTLANSELFTDNCLVPIAAAGGRLTEPRDRRLHRDVRRPPRPRAVRLCRLGGNGSLGRPRQHGRRHRLGHRSAPGPGDGRGLELSEPEWSPSPFPAR